MGSRRQRIACLPAALVLGLSGSAWGQGAGDEQYQDPFGDDEGQEAPAAPQEPDEPASSGEDLEPAPAAPPPPAQPAQTPPAAEGQGGGDQLPYTGAGTGLLALGGAALLASGLALRRRSS